MNKVSGLKDNFQQGDCYEKYQFFYHPDHLGSTSYITDNEGNATQFVCYMPYGETLVDEHTTAPDPAYLTAYKFNGKEMDVETGLYYYGARYYEPELAVWYGVDALAEKYPNMGGYVYCAGNPVLYIDPDGNKKLQFKVGFSINSGIVGFGCKFLGVKYIFDGAKEIEISTDICFDFDKGKLYIGGARTETTFIEGGIGLAGVYGYSETKQKETSCEIEAGYDFNNETIFGDIITNEQEQHNTTEFTLGIYNNNNNENTNKSEISISTDVHIDVLLVGTKIEGGLFFEE